MITVRNAEILDVLPYTFKTNEYKALSRAVQSINAYVYDTLSNVLFWADIEHAGSAVLDAMAAELDAPFYSAELPDDQKRTIIAAAYIHNSRSGTVSSISNLISAAFGGGTIEEWYKYGGNAYCFRVNVETVYPAHVTQEDHDTFMSNLNKLKPVRAKLDEVSFRRELTSKSYAGIGILCRRKITSIPAEKYNDEERGYQ